MKHELVKIKRITKPGFLKPRISHGSLRNMHFFVALQIFFKERMDPTLSLAAQRRESELNKQLF